MLQLNTHTHTVDFLTRFLKKNPHLFYCFKTAAFLFVQLSEEGNLPWAGILPKTINPE